MSPQKTGLLVSGTTHLGLLFAIFITVTSNVPVTSSDQEQVLSVSLDIFVPQPEPATEVLVEDTAERDPPQEISNVIPEPETIIAEKHIENTLPLVTPPPEAQPDPEQNKLKHKHMDDSESVLAVPETDTTYFRLLEQQYSDALKLAIEANKFYPSRARRQAREGDVVVGFKISREGNIKNIRVVRSSSVRILDKAAINAVFNVGRFHPIPSHIIRDWWEFEISLSYNLL